MTYPASPIAPYPSAAQFPQIGEKTVLYVDLSTNILYTFDGVAYHATQGVILPSDVLNVLLTGLNVTAPGAIVSTDSVLTGFGKTQKQINDANTALAGKEPTIAPGNVADYWRGDKTWRNFATDVRGTILTGLSTASSAIVAATDTVLAAIGQLQGQITSLLAGSTNFSKVSLFGQMQIQTIASNGGMIEIGSLAAVTSNKGYGLTQYQSIPASTTGFYFYNNTFGSIQPGSYTLGELRHYNASQGGIGSGASLTNQIGFYAEASLSGATNNYGFRGELTKATNRYNIYMSGTADNYMSGALGIGAVPSGNDKLVVTGSALATAPTRPGSYTVATMPAAASYLGYNIFVSNATGGAITAVSDGTNWRRLDTYAIVT